MKELNEKNAFVSFDRELECLKAKLSGFIPIDQFERIMEFEYEMIRHFNIKQCLIDLSEIQVYPKGGQEYIKGTWFPTVKRLGVKFIAFVLPDSAFGNASMKNAHAREEQNGALTLNNFKDQSSAREWLVEISGRKLAG